MGMVMNTRLVEAEVITDNRTSLVNFNDKDNIEALTGGGTASTDNTLGGYTYSIRWNEHTINPDLEIAIDGTNALTNWGGSGYNCNYIQVQIYSAKATNAKIKALAVSPEKDKGYCYFYWEDITVDWTGWKTFTFAKSNRKQSNKGETWANITSFRLCAGGGWSITANPETDLYIGAIDILKESSDPLEPNVARVGNENYTNYTSLQAAIDAAATEDTITLLDDITESSIELNKKITLDLKGKILTATYFKADNETNVVDSSGNKTGRLKVAAENGTLATTNEQVPVYIADEGYMFATMLGQSSVSKTDDSFTVISRPSFGSAYEKLAGGADVAKLQFIIRLDWGEVTDGKHEYYQEFVYNNDTVKTVYGNDKAFSVTVNGLTGYTENMKVTVLVRSTDLEVDWVNNEFYMSSAN